MSKIDDDIKSAGKSFLGLYLGELLSMINELDDKGLKGNLIEEYHSHQRGYYDRDIGGTKTRVNASIRIIKANKVLCALERIGGSDLRVRSEAVTRAEETIRKIKTGELNLPNLD